MEIGNNTTARLTDVDAGSKAETAARVDSSRGKERARNNSVANGDAVSASAERSLVSQAAEAESAERQGRIAEIAAQIERGEYNPRAEDVSRAIVKDLLGE